MTIAIELGPSAISRAGSRRDVGPLATAGFASLGAGAIHAAAIGIHAEHRQAVWAFVITAVFQLVWGALSLIRSGRVIALLGIAGNAALAGGWLMSKTTGIGFVAGLDEREPIQFADGLAAALAVLAVLATVAAIVRRSRPDRPGLTLMVGAAVAALALPGMVSAGSHRHSGSSGHDHATAAASSVELAGAADAGVGAADAGATAAHSDDHAAGTHSHADDASATPTAAAPGSEPSAVESVPSAPGATGTTPAGHSHTTGAGGAGHGDHAAVVPPVAYDPTKPLDFGGVEGVTPEQQAAAENLVAITLARLPKFSDPAVAEALGWQSIGDGLTGFEHYINWDLINDDDYLNPDMPESLVYEIDRATGEKRLASAMFMLRDTIALADVPNIGGPLMQWHIHDNLCFTTDDPPLVRAVTQADGSCAPGFQKFRPAPMIHVWIQPHRCGPFAALEGVGAGQILEGEERLCDVAHGSGF